MEYDCPKAKNGKCKHGGNKRYNYGFVSGTAYYCYLTKKWVQDIKKCPKGE